VAASRLALDGVSTTLIAGQVLAITGPSGAGKSTLTTVLAGLQRPTRGTVRSDPLLRTRQGDEPWRWRSAELATRLSWSPQFPEHGIVTATVLDEVLATARACVRPAEPSYVRATGLLEVMSLSGLTEVSPYHLSGGEQRRLMVAAALAHGPAGVLFDEPTVGQDRRTWATVLGAVKAAATAGSGVAVSTHDETAVAALGATVLRLQEGRVRG
jgi:energy-coupling factor transport system ATP-binding protein